MRYPYHPRPRIRLGRTILFGLLVFAIVCLSGCGLVADGVNVARTVQLPAGNLYSKEFYRGATPEEVKKAIGNRSLAEEVYVEKSFSKPKGGFMMPQGLLTTLQVFIPDSSVDEDDIYPLQVAYPNTRYPEVLTILIEAGANPNTVIHMVRQDAWDSRSSHAKVRAVFPYYSEETQKRLLEEVASGGDAELMAYCLDIVNLPPGSEYFTLAMHAALQDMHNGLIALLLERGASLPDDKDAQVSLLRSALMRNNPEGYLAMRRYGADASYDSSQYDLIYAAETGRVKDEAVLRDLIDNAPLTEKTEAILFRLVCRAGNIDMLNRLAGKRKGIPEGSKSQILLHDVMHAKRPDMFWRLVELGAKCSYSPNDLMCTAKWNAPEKKIIQHLAEHVPVEGSDGHYALVYAIRSGYAEPVRTLMERGCAPVHGESIPHNAPEPDALREVMWEYGLLPEDR
ncbi:MAG: hypothetical protein DELT_01985 [Desulfovibrio sp.]